MLLSITPFLLPYHHFAVLEVNLQTLTLKRLFLFQKLLSQILRTLTHTKVIAFFQLLSFMLMIWPFGPPPPPLLWWRPHKELGSNCSAGLSTGIFLSIRANMRPPFQWIPTKLTSSRTSYSTPVFISVPLQLFLGLPSITLFTFLNMFLR